MTDEFCSSYLEALKGPNNSQASWTEDNQKSTQILVPVTPNPVKRKSPVTGQEG
jgi:hypothetical protein